MAYPPQLAPAATARSLSILKSEFNEMVINFVKIELLPQGIC